MPTKCALAYAVTAVASALCIIVPDLVSAGRPQLQRSEPQSPEPETAKPEQIQAPFGREIVGGQETDIRQHPWQVALEFKGTFFCGGSLIADVWVLTAAHCFRSAMLPSDWRAKAGATRYISKGVWTDFERVFLHERFNPVAFENDIALVKLRQKTAGRAIELSASSLVLQVGEALEVTGWGATREGGAPSENLFKANVPYVDSTVCNEPSSYAGRVSPGMLCAGYRDGGIDSCQGDSGGPLVLGAPGRPVLVGVVSFGEGCARKLKYGVYTRVNTYRDWIDRVIAANSN
jgi:secreted trypsin-like serine protease